MTPRLYITADLSADTVVPIGSDHAHYLKNVLRRGQGDSVLLFNGRDGEFSATLGALKKKGGMVRVTAQTKPQAPELNLMLYFAPVKRAPVELIIQKAAEIGCAQLQPVITEHTTGARLNIDRLQVIATEASEQCGRLSVPVVRAPTKLAAALADWPDDQRLVFCDEAGDDETQEWGGKTGRALPMLDALESVDSKTEHWAILTGPEGGFSARERAHLRAQSFVTPVTLGPRILRADTAAIAALVLWQAALGDWGEA